LAFEINNKMKFIKKYLVTIAMFVILFIFYQPDQIRIRTFSYESFYKEIIVAVKNKYLIDPGERICGENQEQFYGLFHTNQS
jgi:hypothetical protein